MGFVLSKLQDLYSSWSTISPSRILLLGLDNAGKTCILYKLKLNETITTIPTIGFNVETVTPYKGITFTVWDVGGQDKIRRLWRYYFQNTDGLFFVVDSADLSRMNESAEELHAILEDDSMRGVPVVIMANKQDLPNALTSSQIIKKLKLDELKNKWFINATNGHNGDGLFECVKEMAEMIANKKR